MIIPFLKKMGKIQKEILKMYDICKIIERFYKIQTTIFSEICNNRNK